MIKILLIYDCNTCENYCIKLLHILKAQYNIELKSILENVSEQDAISIVLMCKRRLIGKVTRLIMPTILLFRKERPPEPHPSSNIVTTLKVSDSDFMDSDKTRVLALTISHIVSQVLMYRSLRGQRGV